MGRKSTRTNKTAYQLEREKLEYTREQAAELMEYISADRIEKIESEKSLPHPEEVLAMSKCYNSPELCNFYCSHECPIGAEYVPEVKIKELSQITLEMLNSLNAIDKEKSRFIEITVDGKVTDDELEDFHRINDRLTEISNTISSLQLWLKKAFDQNNK